MITCSKSRRYLLLAGTIGTLAAAVSSAMGQQPPASTEAPPPWAQGRPDTAIRANPPIGLQLPSCRNIRLSPDAANPLSWSQN
jgi:hypothetical protein